MIKTFIDIHDSRWEKYKIDYAKIANSAVGFVREKGDGEVSIILTNDSEIHGLNKKIPQNKPTNKCFVFRDG